VKKSRLGQSPDNTSTHSVTQPCSYFVDVWHVKKSMWSVLSSVTAVVLSLIDYVVFDVFVFINPSSNHGTHSYFLFIFLYLWTYDDVFRNIIVQLVAGLKKINIIQYTVDEFVYEYYCFDVHMSHFHFIYFINKTLNYTWQFINQFESDITILYLSRTFVFVFVTNNTW